MAEAIKFEGSTHDFGPPVGLEEMIGRLHIFSNGHCTVSAWKLTPEEIEAGVVFVSVMSGSQPTYIMDEATGEIAVAMRPIVFPIFVGDEESCKAVVSDTGKVW